MILVLIAVASVGGLVLFSPDPTPEEECEKSSNPNNRDSCFALIAEVGNVQRTCGKILNSLLKDQCFAHVAEEAGDAALCGFLGGPKDDCLNAVAQAVSDVDVCGQMQFSDRKDACVVSLVKNGGSPEWCNRVLSLEIRDSCFSDAAALQRLPALCAYMSTSTDGCYFRVATDMRDGGTCALLGVSSMRDKCYSDIAVLTKDSLLCAKIKMLTARRECVQKVK